MFPPPWEGRPVTSEELELVLGSPAEATARPPAQGIGRKAVGRLDPPDAASSGGVANLGSTPKREVQAKELDSRPEAPACPECGATPAQYLTKGGLKCRVCGARWVRASAGFGERLRRAQQRASRPFPSDDELRPKLDPVAADAADRAVRALGGGLAAMLGPCGHPVAGFRFVSVVEQECGECGARRRPFRLPSRSVSAGPDCVPDDPRHPFSGRFGHLTDAQVFQHFGAGHQKRKQSMKKANENRS